MKRQASRTTEIKITQILNYHNVSNKQTPDLQKVTIKFKRFYGLSLRLRRYPLISLSNI